MSYHFYLRITVIALLFAPLYRTILNGPVIPIRSLCVYLHSDDNFISIAPLICDPFGYPRGSEKFIGNQLTAWWNSFKLENSQESIQDQIVLEHVAYSTLVAGMLMVVVPLLGECLIVLGALGMMVSVVKNQLPVSHLDELTVPFWLASIIGLYLLMSTCGCVDREKQRSRS